MADSGERRMLFDIRGRRKHVVRVVYAVLALLMGASLFLVVGPFNLGELAGGGGGQDASEVFEEQAERIEGRLRVKPEDEGLLLALSRARLNAGGALQETNPQTGQPIVTPEAKAQFEQGFSAWDDYLEAADEVNPTVAGLVAGTYFSVAEGSGTFEEINENVEGAAETQALAAKARPTPGAFSTLAIYEFFNGNFAAGDKAVAQAKGLIASKAERRAVEKQLDPYRKSAQIYRKQVREFEKTQKGKGKEAFESALGGLGGSLSGASE